jgi:hypothetical protein
MMRSGIQIPQPMHRVGDSGRPPPFAKAITFLEINFFSRCLLWLWRQFGYGLGGIDRRGRVRWSELCEQTFGGLVLRAFGSRTHHVLNRRSLPYNPPRHVNITVEGFASKNLRYAVSICAPFRVAFDPLGQHLAQGVTKRVFAWPA